MKKNNLPQHNDDMLELTEEVLDQITGGATKTYTVQKGDNLSAIAAKKYGSGTKWQQLYQKNKKVVGNNPDLILPGGKLEL